MNCGSCELTDKFCYCSMPPKVKCIVTNEFHYYDDECNCVEAAKLQNEELERFKRKIREPCEPAPILALNYDGPSAPSVAFIGETPAAERKSLNKLHVNSETSNIGVLDTEAWVRAASQVTEGSTPCLVCGESVMVNLFESYTKICPICKKAIMYIREKFGKEFV